MKRLAIVTTHPVQYNAPFFKLLTHRKKIQVKVFYTWGKSVLENKYDPGFGRAVEWDIPLLNGYEYCFVENTAATPGSHTFKGIDNPTLISLIEDWNADAVLVYGWSFKSHLKCIRYFHKKIPVLFRGDSTLLDSQPLLKKTIRYFFLQWVYGNIDAALYAGANNKAYFKKYGLDERKLFFAPHAIDNERFGDNSSRKYEARAKEWRDNLGLTQTDTVFLFAGKLESKKDPLLLVQLFKKFKKTTIHLLIAGNGPLEQQLKSIAADNANIQFIGFQNQSIMPVLYRLADCFVLPSKGPSETWGLAVNEAMASSRPVIASNKCGCAEDLIHDGVNGYIFIAGDEESLCSKIKKFVVEKENGNNMSNAACKNIQKWQFAEICKPVENILG